MPDRSLQFGGPGVPDGVSIQQVLDFMLRVVSANPTFYPWYLIPPDGKAFDKVGTIPLPAAGGGMGPSPGVETEVVRITCPAGYSGIVRRIANNFLGPSFNAGLPSLIWRIRNGASISNSQFVDNYNEIVVEYGSTQQPRPTDGIFIATGQTLIYTVTNQDPTIPIDPTTQVSCCFAGFFWPVQRDLNAKG